MASTITDPLAVQVHRHVFVYGTLRRGEERDINRLTPVPIFISNSKIKGTLYHLGNYPGARLEGEQWLHGEVYQITSELERQLDAIEEVWPQQTGEYVKQEVLVLCSGAALTCLFYEVAEARIKSKEIITSGDWIKRKLTSSNATPSQ